MSNKKIVHVTHNSGCNEWYTPSYIINAARQTMGSIDVDPASNQVANLIVCAKQYYTIETNGLNKPWTGNVWLNPPYNKSITAFIDTLVAKIESGEVKQACVLTNNATETKWFQKLLKVSNALCFLSKRVKFNRIGGRAGSPLQGQIVTYVGSHAASFFYDFKELGFVLEKRI